MNWCAPFSQRVVGPQKAQAKVPIKHVLDITDYSSLTIGKLRPIARGCLRAVDWLLNVILQLLSLPGKINNSYKVPLSVAMAKLDTKLGFSTKGNMLPCSFGNSCFSIGLEVGTPDWSGFAATGDDMSAQKMDL